MGRTEKRRRGDEEHHHSSSRSSRSKRHRHDRDRDRRRSSSRDRRRSSSRDRKHRSSRKKSSKHRSRFAEAPAVEAATKASAADMIEQARIRAQAAAAAISRSVSKTAAVPISNLNQSLASGNVKPTAVSAAHKATLLAQEALQKAKRAALIQHQIQRSLQVSASAIEESVPNVIQDLPGGFKTRGFMPAPLILDNQGRQVDQAGRLLDATGVRPVTTLKINKKAVKKDVNPYLAHRTVDNRDQSTIYDERLKTVNRNTRGTKAFKFVEKGRFVKKGDALRARDQRKAITASLRRSGVNVHADMYDSQMMPSSVSKKAVGSSTGSDGLTKGAAVVGKSTNANMTPLGKRVTTVEASVAPELPDEPVPEVEWWDIPFLPPKERQRVEDAPVGAIEIDFSTLSIEYVRTAKYVEHPVVESVAAKAAPKTIPLMLTKKERKRIRRQTRSEREKEKQDKIRLGLMAPPEPKVKISNLMRVLGEEAVADPSAVERKVREQMATRQHNHDMRNLARKLTPEERREKRRRKLAEDTIQTCHVAVFRVPDVSNPRNRFKIDVNAQENYLTGRCVVCKTEDFNLVVVEGGPRGITRFVKLMTKRINWDEVLVDGEVVEQEEEEEYESDDSDAPPRQSKPKAVCTCVWQGTAIKRLFADFQFEECRTAATARTLMEARGCVQFWDMVSKPQRAPIGL